jgi:redox-sensitive bicupin YhaK (pirin superfamily)
VIERPAARGLLLLGSVDGHCSPAKLHSSAYLIHWMLEPEAELIPQTDYPERAVHIVSGEIEYDGQSFGPGQMVTLVPGAFGSFRTKSPSEVVEFGGAPVGPRYKWWNFIASRVELIEAAKRRWLNDDRSLPPGESEFTPLPADHERPLQLLRPGASAVLAAEEAA